MRIIVLIGLFVGTFTGAIAEEEKAPVAKAELSQEQVALLKGGKTIQWEEQGISWTLPAGGWSKIEVKKSLLNYGSPGAGFLIGTISTMPSSFPMDISREMAFKGAMDKVDLEEYEMARWLEVDGVKGIEWVEVMPEDTGDPRRHQWIGYRKYQGKNQMVNIMVTTKGSQFEAKKALFAAILHSMSFAEEAE